MMIIVAKIMIIVTMINDPFGNDSDQKYSGKKDECSYSILPFWQGRDPSEFQMGPRDVLAFGWQVKIRSFWKSNDLLVGLTGAL